MLARRSRAIWLMTAGSEVAPHRVAAERKRKAGLLQPPGAEIGPEMESGVGVGELALVDQQSDLDLAPLDRVLDLIEGNHLGRCNPADTAGAPDRPWSACREPPPAGP